MYPEWVLKYKRPGTTVKQIGKNYLNFPIAFYKHGYLQ